MVNFLNVTLVSFEVVDAVRADYYRTWSNAAFLLFCAVEHPVGAFSVIRSREIFPKP
jgi:hypothetical protein